MPQAPKPHVSVLEDTGDVLEIESVVNLEGGALAKLAAEEAFMNETVIVHVYQSTNDNDPPHGILSVNGTNQPFDRGIDTPMKRKYLEVLARMRETKFSQPQRDMMNPEAGNSLVPRTADVYPFEVVEDTRAGREWLKRVRASA